MKDTIKRMERKIIAWQKASAQHTADNTFISKIHKELLKLYDKEITQFLKVRNSFNFYNTEANQNTLQGQIW